MTLLQLHNVTREFGGVMAVNGVSLSLAAGEIKALVGPNGCGKTTLFHLITGGLRPTSGRIEFEGRDITGWAPHRIAAAGIGRKFQVPSVFDELTVAENLALGSWAPQSLGADGPSSADFEQIKLAGKGQTRAGELSHGQRQWLEIGMVLAGRPRLLLLDEPTAGMTAAETEATVELIRAVAAEREVTVLAIEHDIGFLERLDCSVSVMARGRILLSGSFDEVRAARDVRTLYFGGAA